MIARALLDTDLGSLSNLVATVIANTQTGLALLNVGKTALLVPAVTTPAAGQPFTLAVNFISGPDPLTAIQFDVIPAAGIILSSATIGAAGTAAGKSVSSSQVAGNLRCLLFGVNQTPVASGILLTIAGTAGTTKGIASLSFINIVGSKADGTTGRLSATSALMTIQ